MGSFTVPQSITPGSALPPVGASKAADPEAGKNPYAFASGSGGEGLAGEALPRGDLMIQRARMEQIFSLGWAVFTARWQPLVLGGLIYIAVSIGFGMLVGIVTGVVSMIGGGIDQDAQNLITMALTFVIGIFSWYIWLGLGNLALKVCRNEQASPAHVFMPVSIFVKLIPVLIPFFVLTLVSQIASSQLQPNQPGQNLQGDPELIFVSMGITFGSGLLNAIVLLFVWPKFFLALDNRSDESGSMGTALQIATKNLLNGFLLWWIVRTLMIVPVLLTCCIAMVATEPLMLVFGAVGYLLMTGQPISDPNAVPMQTPDYGYQPKSTF